MYMLTVSSGTTYLTIYIFTASDCFILEGCSTFLFFSVSLFFHRICRSDNPSLIGRVATSHATSKMSLRPTTVLDSESNAKGGVFQPITLPCGRTLQNRLVKVCFASKRFYQLVHQTCAQVAMYEHLASFPGGPPNEYHLRLYSEWAKYDWGIVVTGNVQTTADHLTLGRDLVLPTSEVTDERLLPFQKLAQSIHGLYSHPPPGSRCRKPNKTLAIMQLNHPGRQSSNFIGGRLPFRAPSAPSSIPLGYGINSSLTSRLIYFILFQKPRAMSHEDIQRVVKGFIDGAVAAYRAGFDGVQLHVAHGCTSLIYHFEIN
jgi:2,4-dienoyl-CoA reductase-like NADH-dependent reductase (Old Yellow Enzyme family)